MLIYTPMIKKAFRICCEAHSGQTDKTGLPYCLHPVHLSYQMGDDENAVITALLHDVAEDTDITLSDLEQEGFNKEIIKALTLLTHDPKIPYMEYIENIKANELAKKVKIADLTHNSDLSRLDKINDRDLERTQKYKKAIRILNGND